MPLDLTLLLKELLQFCSVFFFSYLFSRFHIDKRIAHRDKGGVVNVSEEKYLASLNLIELLTKKYILLLNQVGMIGLKQSINECDYNSESCLKTMIVNLPVFSLFVENPIKLFIITF